MKNPMKYESFDGVDVILDCKDCQENDYKCQDKHRWGVCHARCISCGMHSNVTVIRCESNDYLCYECDSKVGA